MIEKPKRCSHCGCDITDANSSLQANDDMCAYCRDEYARATRSWPYDLVDDGPE